jgi:HlyD family secretion protein
VQTTAGGVSATGTVRVSSPALDPRTHKAKVIVSVPAAGLVPYATASARLVLDAKEGVIVPRRAVMATDAGDSVFAVRDNAARRVQVTLGVAEGDRIQVDGVNDGDAIVIEGLDQISDGSAVEVAPEAK